MVLFLKGKKKVVKRKIFVSNKVLAQGLGCL